jgi:predicted transcriptional regulator
MENTKLAQLGFSDKEIAVYLAVLKQGKILPAEVAKLTGLNRSTVYSVANALKKRGVISEDIGGPASYLVAESPEDLFHLAEQEELNLEKKKKVIKEAVQDLKQISATSVYSPPKINFITQDELLPYLYKRAPVWSNSVMNSDGIWWGFQDHTFVEKYGEWIDWYWTKAVPKGLHLILLSNKSQTEAHMIKKQFIDREIRFWKDAGEFTASIWISGDYIVMIETRQEPHFLVEIHDKTLAHNMREVFKGINKTIK